MTRLLRIDASARTSRSLTRELSETFQNRWMQRRPHDEIVSRDVGRNPPPFITEDWIAAAFASERSQEQIGLVAPSDELIAEVASADIIFLATPMYTQTDF